LAATPGEPVAWEPPLLNLWYGSNNVLGWVLTCKLIDWGT